jgi:hypothetical protein
MQADGTFQIQVTGDERQTASRSVGATIEECTKRVRLEQVHEIGNSIIMSRLHAVQAGEVDWTPRLRQSVKLHFAVRCRSIVGRG